MLLRPLYPRKALLSYGARFNSTAAKPSEDWIVAISPRPDKLNISKEEKEKGVAPNLGYLRHNDQRSSIAARLAKRRTSQEKGRQLDKTLRTVENNADILNNFSPLLESPGPLPLAKSAKPTKKPNVEIPDHMLSPLSLKRREERHRREREELRLREKRLNLYRKPVEISFPDDDEFENDEDSDDMSEVDLAEVEQCSPMAEFPEIDGPESISETLDDPLSGTVQYHPPANGHDVSKSLLNPDLICSLVGGNYSQHTSSSSRMTKATSPNALKVVNTAELALSHRPDYIIPQRKQAIKIVKNLVDRSSYKAKLSNDTEPALFRGELEK